MEAKSYPFADYFPLPFPEAVDPEPEFEPLPLLFPVELDPFPEPVGAQP